MWWSKAAELVNALRNGEYEEMQRSGSHDLNLLPIMIRRGELEFVRVKEGMTVRQLISRITAKPNYALIHVKRDVFNRVLGRTILDGEAVVTELKGINWEASDVDGCDIWMVDLSQEVTVMFNTYFRLVTGTPNHVQRLYIEPGMTVADFEQELKRSLAIPLDDFRMGLYGFEHGEVSPLDGDLLMSELKSREADLASPSFFQFQFHPESECQAHLGVSRASNLIMRVNRGTRKMKKCWFYLQGTSLFYRPTRTDSRWVKELKQVDQAKVIYRGKGQGQSMYRFDLIPMNPSQPIRVFFSPLKERIVKWVKALRESHPSLEINEPVTMETLKKSLGQEQFEKKIEAGSTVQSSIENSPLEQVSFYQRRMIEMAEACQQKVDLNSGILKLNGLESEDSDALVEKWVEAVRELLYHCCSKMQPRKSAKAVIDLSKGILRKIRPWVAFIEAAANEADDEGELLETLSEVVEDATSLVHAFRLYVYYLNSGPSDEIQDAKDFNRTLETLELLQDGLAGSLFQKKAKKRFNRSRVILRGVFKPDEDNRRAREEAKLKAKAEKEKAKRRKQRAKEGSKAVWSILSQGMSPNSCDFDEDHQVDDELEPEDMLSYDINEYGTRYNNISYDNLLDQPNLDDVVPSRWERVRAFFQRRTTKNSNNINYNEIEQDQVEAESSNQESDYMDNGDRLSESRWSQAEALFRAYSRKNRNQPIEREVSPTNDVVVQSGFSRAGTKAQHYTPAPQEHDDASTIQASEPGEVESELGSPVRTSPEDEALLLKMLKDPRVKDLLNEYKDSRRPSVSNQPEPNTVRDHVKTWRRQ